MWKLTLLALFAVSCGQNQEGKSCPNPAGFTVNGSIESVSPCSSLGGGKAAGATCAHDYECAAFCCACPNASNGSADVNYCHNGVCATEEEACCTFANNPGSTCGP
jgi:hypothetical protein